MRREAARPGGAWLCALLTLAATTVGCGPASGPEDTEADRPADRAETDHGEDEHAGHDHDERADRLDVSAAVRRSLGIEFAAVEARHVARTLRVPGRFEYVPTAHREVRAPLAGRVELLVAQFDTVRTGSPLFAVASPRWRELQGTLLGLDAAIARLETSLRTLDAREEAHRAHEERLAASIEVEEARVEQLEALGSAGGGRVTQLIDAKAALATARAQLAQNLERGAELVAEREVGGTELTSARRQREQLVDALASIAGTDPTSDDTAWLDAPRVLVRAQGPGVVDSIELTDGAWALEGAQVLGIVDPTGLRFRGRALLVDVDRLAAAGEGLVARAVPRPADPAGGLEPIAGRVRLGLTADATARTLDVLLEPEALEPWARDGRTAELEIVLDAGRPAVPAVPLAAVQREGLETIVFRRNPVNPEEVIRTEVTVGEDDGAWVEVPEGLEVGDRVVVAGSYQLRLATDETAAKGGHFHSDGTFHGDDH